MTPSLIKDLTITEVSSVSRGAGEGVKVLLMKVHRQGAAEEVLRRSIASIDDDDPDRAEFVRAQAQAYREHVASTRQRAR